MMHSLDLPGILPLCDFPDLPTDQPACSFNYLGFHAHRPDFTAFRYRMSGIHFGTYRAALDRAYSDDEFVRSVGLYLLRIRRPLVIDRDFDWEGEHLLWDDEPTKGLLDDDQCIERWFLENGFDVFHDDGRTLMEPFDIISRYGYDAIFYRNAYEDKGSYSVAMFDPFNIMDAGREALAAMIRHIPA